MSINGMLWPHEFLTVWLSEQKYLVSSLILPGNWARIKGGLMYGTEVPRSKLGLDLRPGMDPECGTKMPKCKLGLGLKIGSTTPYLISLLCTALVSYKFESRSLTNAQRDFPGRRRKANPTYHGMLGNFLGTSLPGISAWLGTEFQSHKLGFLFSPKHPLRADNIGPHCRTYLLKLEPSSKATTTIFNSHLNNHLKRITLDL